MFLLNQSHIVNGYWLVIGISFIKTYDDKGFVNAFEGPVSEISKTVKMQGLVHYGTDPSPVPG